MFDKAIIDTDKFLNISLTAKALYFLMGMEADDEGFVSPNKVLRLYGGEYGDIKNLIDAGFVIPFQSGVVVLTHWNENNYLDKNRIKPTQYQSEKKMLALTEHKKYELNTCSTRGEERRGVESSIEEHNNLETSVSTFDSFWNIYPKKTNKKKSRDLWNSKKLNSKSEIIAEFISKAKETDRWKKGYIKAPDVFIRNESWEDDLSAYNDKFNNGTNILKL